MIMNRYVYYILIIYGVFSVHFLVPKGQHCDAQIPRLRTAKATLYANTLVYENGQRE